jgi:thioredoxin reductase (NADPH)
MRKRAQLSHRRAAPSAPPAVIYLARFRHGAELVDVGESRATLIPRTHIHAGYPGGIPGKKLLALMRRQASQFGATARSGLVETPERGSNLFVVRVTDEAECASSSASRRRL